MYVYCTFVLLTVQFSSAMLGGLCEATHPQLSSKLVHLYGSLSNMRVMLRLLDDLPALAYTLKTWTSSKKVGVATLYPAPHRLIHTRHSTLCSQALPALCNEVQHYHCLP